MTDRPGTLHLNAFSMTTGHHEASWRLLFAEQVVPILQRRGLFHRGHPRPHAA